MDLYTAIVDDATYPLTLLALNVITMLAIPCVLRWHFELREGWSAFRHGLPDNGELGPQCWQTQAEHVRNKTSDESQKTIEDGGEI